MIDYFKVTSRLLGDPKVYGIAASNVKKNSEPNEELARWRVEGEILSISKAIMGFRENAATDEEALLHYKQDRGINFALVAGANPGQVRTEMEEIRSMYVRMFEIAEIALTVRSQLIREKRGWLLPPPQ